MNTKLALAATLSCALLAACGKGGPQAPAAGGGAPAMPPAEVDVITVQPGSATLTQDLPGRLLAYRSAEVRARVEGVVEQQLYKEGSDVAAGTPLFRIDARTYEASAAAAAADVDATRAQFERYKPLLESKMVSPQEYDAANARYKQAQAALAKARLDLENAVPRAPIKGRAGRALVTEGALVGKGTPTHLLTIEQIDPIRVEFSQSYSDVMRLQQAVKSGKQQRADSAQVQLLLEDGSLYPAKGRLQFADLAVDPASGAVVMRAEFPNPQHELLPGAFVRVRFPSAKMEQALSVPQRAVSATPQGQVVMVVDAENKVTPRPVVTGAMAGSDFIITSGLAPGDKVIVNGLQKARPGSVVKPVEWNPQAPLLPAPPAPPGAAAAPDTSAGKK